MADRINIKISEVIEKASRGREMLVMEVDGFARHKVTCTLGKEVKADIMTDSLKQVGLKVHYVSLHGPQGGVVELSFRTGPITVYPHGTIVMDTSRDSLYWLPRSPFLRTYDAQGRMVSNTPCDFKIVEPGTVVVAGADRPIGRLEFTLVFFESQRESVYRQLAEFVPQETRLVVKSTWLRYEGVGSLFDYLFNGMTYSTRHLPAQKAWDSQNIAHALYDYLGYLGNITGKSIYGALCDLIAYSVLLSLPSDGRWRHGIWTDLMETHTVHQVAGLHVLLSHYQKTGKSVFIAKAKAAALYLLDCVDRLDDGIWFLHDSLENSPAEVSLYYKGMTSSTAFGKSESNTLTLNSHVSTMTVLERLNTLVPDQRYVRAVDAGLIALRCVLAARPCSIVYGALYAWCDILRKICLIKRSSFLRRIHLAYEDVLRHNVLPRLKCKYPRFIMPDGFLERDLCFAPLSYFYHLVNLKVLLVLYSMRPDEWLRKIICKGMRYTFRSGFPDYMMTYTPWGSMLLDILLMYAGLIDAKYLCHLARHLRHFHRSGIPLQTDVLADPLVADPSPLVRSEICDAVLLACARGSQFHAALFNLVDTDITVSLHVADKRETARLKIVDSRNRSYALGQAIHLSGGAFLKVLKEDG